MNLRRWLTVGIGVKRWLVVAFLGLLILALGVAHVIRQVTATALPGGPAAGLIDLLTLQFLPYQLRGLVAGAVGLALFLLGSYRLIRALLDPLATWDRDQPMVDVIYQKRFLARGPRVVAIGGGTGLSALLRGLKEHTSNLTAVVTVADDGGSSGVLRTELGIPAVGDIRNCIVALADAEPLMGRLLQYRFPVGPVGDEPDEPDDDEAAAGTATGAASGRTAPASVEPEAAVEPGAAVEPAVGVPADEMPGLPPARGAEALSVGLGGHALGNLLLAALTALEDGDFEEGVREMNRVLAVRGRVVPATGTVLSLHARLQDGTEVEGQSRIARTGSVERVWVTPADVRASDDAVRAIGEADLIVIGPGSLYTSILPALLVPGIADAVRRSEALVLFVCNVATQAGETDHYDLAGHVEALHRHDLAELPEVVLANNRLDARPPERWRGEAVRLRWPPSVPAGGGPRLVLEDVVDPVNAHRHDPGRLASAVMGIWERERGSRRRPAATRVGRAS